MLQKCLPQKVPQYQAIRFRLHVDGKEEVALEMPASVLLEVLRKAPEKLQAHVDGQRLLRWKSKPPVSDADCADHQVPLRIVLMKAVGWIAYRVPPWGQSAHVAFHQSHGKWQEGWQEALEENLRLRWQLYAETPVSPTTTPEHGPAHGDL